MTSLLEGEKGRAGLVFLEEVGVFGYLWLSLLKEMKRHYTEIAHCISTGFCPLLKIRS